MFRSYWFSPFRLFLRAEHRSVEITAGLAGGLSLAGWIGWWSRELWALDLHLTVDLREKNGISLGFQVLPVRGAVGLDRVIPRAWTQAWYRKADADHEGGRSRYWAHELVDTRETGIRIDETARLSVWKSDSAWSSTSRNDWPWRTHGWEFAVPWVDLLLGATRYEEEPGTWHDAELAIDGRSVPMRVHLYRCRWRRSRPWGSRLTHAWGAWVHRACISVAGHDHHDPDRGAWLDSKGSAYVKPPGYAGKGENSWDCDDNATYVMTVAVRPMPYTVAEIVSEYRADVEKSRAKYGMPTEAA